MERTARPPSALNADELSTTGAGFSTSPSSSLTEEPRGVSERPVSRKRPSEELQTSCSSKKMKTHTSKPRSLDVKDHSPKKRKASEIDLGCECPAKIFRSETSSTTPLREPERQQEIQTERLVQSALTRPLPASGSKSRSLDCRSAPSDPRDHNPNKRKASEIDPGCELPAKVSRLEKSSTKPQGEAESRQSAHPEEPAQPEGPKTTLLPALDPAEFAENYVQQKPLGEGGFGAVFAGVRKSDQLPVAIKHIPRNKVQFIPLTIGEEHLTVPKEVALMCQAGCATGSVGQNPSVSLVDWSLLDKELVLVLERPTPAEDLFEHCAKYAPIPEEYAKEITRQVAVALLDLHQRKVFHRDIKLDNILLQETSSPLPRVRIIDFGCGCEVQSEPYTKYSGTFAYAPPEFVRTGKYCAGPTSVWQIGALLYELVRPDDEVRFTTKDHLIGNISCPMEVSQECQDFLEACLQQNPKERISLEQLSLHSWFKQ